MSHKNIKELADRYILTSFSVTKTGESLLKCQMGDEVTSDQHYMLRYIYKSRECTSTELAEVFEVKKSAITAIINRLWEKDLIERTRDEKDRRVVYLSLTEKGEAMYLEAEERIYLLVESLISRFEQEEIEKFLETYEKLNKVLLDIKYNLGE
ncbi:MarR family winged helix-turn-helix transcriptional regulator [Peribacillus sp. SCS-37]|uniref:MarR family winged helix-turn-helix transcriptional regulator n=1 Tax=Paraperibacillus esterisolvens TaxID=3115296 RepID=UPI003905840F